MAQHKRRKHTSRPPGKTSADREDASGGDNGPGDNGLGDRLQKVLAASGVGSRRDCEELIREGRVEIDRKVVSELGTRVDPLRQEIRVDGEALRQPKRLYFAINKPMGVVTTNFDPSGRARVIDLVPTEERVFAVGRLDRASEGLILVTNDGDFSNRITHPRYGVEKTYLVRVAGAPGPSELARLTKGVHLSDGYCRVQSIVTKKRQGQSTDLVMVLNEGRNRELRRVLARVGHKVLRLKRIAVGSVKLSDLPVGAWRRLMPAEIEALLLLAKEKRKALKSKPKRAPGPKGPKPVGSQRDESPYLQQQALMAQPLSLDDLLKDDLGEGGAIRGRDRDDDDSTGFQIEASDELSFSDDSSRKKRGDVIAYEEGEPDEAADSTGPEPSRKQPFRPKPKGSGKKPFRQPAAEPRPATRELAARRGDRPAKRKPSEGAEPVEKLPRESFGKKRGGKKVIGPSHAGRGPAGKVGGNFRFRNKSEGEGDGGGEKRFAKPEGKKFAKPAGKKFAKPAGKKFAKPAGKKFGKPTGGKPSGDKSGPPAGRKFGKAAGKQGGKSFGKPGGKRKGRR
ncbi:MAG: pseudouridine synthase [Pirellulaceae bacterium]